MYRAPRMGDCDLGEGRWVEMEEVETLWCEKHGVWFECKIWVREV